MNEFLDLEKLQAENKKLRTLVTLLLAETELEQRVREIQKNLTNSDDSQGLLCL